MVSTDPAPATDDSLNGLLQQAAATVYCRPALRNLAAALPVDDRVLAAALQQAALRRDAKAFSHLYLAAIYGNRRIDGEVMALGAPLLPAAALLPNTVLRLEGNVAEALTKAIRSGRMSVEREAVALIAAWLDYERRGTPVPADFLALTRKVCRGSVRAALLHVQAVLRHVADLSGDPVVARILNFTTDEITSRSRFLAQVRNDATGLGWDGPIPSTLAGEVALGGGGTLTRAVPKAGRNDPCPCGSGKKFKQCCDGKLSTSDQYAIEGVTISAAAAHPELLLSMERINAMYPHEMYLLDPKLLTPELAGRVASRLSIYGESQRVIEILKAVGRAGISNLTLDQISYEFFLARDIEALKWLLTWAPGALELTFDMEVLLATPAARFELLCQKARLAFEAERCGSRSSALHFSDLGYAALLVDPALGLLIARGTLPVAGWANQEMLIQDMEDARDILGLEDDEPGYQILAAADQAAANQQRHAMDVDQIRAESTTKVRQREEEIQRLKTRIDSMQEDLKRREAKVRQASSQPAAPAQAPAESAETRELREHLRRLKDNLKVEHYERNRALQELRAARDQLRRATRERPEQREPQAPTPAPETETEDPDSAAPDIEWQRQGLLIPEYSAACRDALRHHPRQAAAAALAVAARLAAGDPSAWKTARALKQRPGTLRIRVAGDYRLLFETAPDNTLRLLDFILRRDLERWLAGAGR